MNNNTNNNAPIPVGFRFHPTDEELVGYYLYGKVGGTQLDQLIQELDLYKIEPWDLHEACRIGGYDASATENQSSEDWYFFSHKDKKYPTGNRANRATTAGFWKATGRDKPIHTQRQVIGMRKTLVFYTGRAPHGQKTDWIMHEFRLDDGPGVVPNYESDGWVVCRVFRKTKNLKTNSLDTSCSFEEDQYQLLPGKLERPAAAAVKLVFHDNAHLQRQRHHHHSFTTNPDFTCKQEISVDDYSASMQVDTPSNFLQDPALVQQEHLHDQEHHMQRLHPAAASQLASCSSSSFQSLQQQACRSRADQDQYSVVPFIPTNSFRDVFDDDTRSTATLEAISAFPLLQHDENNTFWMQQQHLVRGRRHP